MPRDPFAFADQLLSNQRNQDETALAKSRRIAEARGVVSGTFVGDFAGQALMRTAAGDRLVDVNTAAGLQEGQPLQIVGNNTAAPSLRAPASGKSRTPLAAGNISI